MKLDSTNMVFMLVKNILSFLDLVDNSVSWYSYTARKVQEVILEGPSRLGNELLSLMRGQDPREAGRRRGSDRSARTQFKRSTYSHFSIKTQLLDQLCMRPLKGKKSKNVSLLY
jgi:hypothetical protein